MDTSNLLEKISMLRSINDNNANNLLILGIDMSALPNNIDKTLMEFVDNQQITGLYEMDSINLELWYLHKQHEVFTLEQDILKPLQRKVKRINRELDQDEKKIKALNESIDDFKKEIIDDGDFQSRSHEIGIVIAEAEKGITKTPLPPVELDCDNLINQVNSLNAARKLKNKNVKKY